MLQGPVWCPENLGHCGHGQTLQLLSKHFLRHFCGEYSIDNITESSPSITMVYCPVGEWAPGRINSKSNIFIVQENRKQKEPSSKSPTSSPPVPSFLYRKSFPPFHLKYLRGVSIHVTQRFFSCFTLWDIIKK